VWPHDVVQLAAVPLSGNDLKQTHTHLTLLLSSIDIGTGRKAVKAGKVTVGLAAFNCTRSTDGQTGRYSIYHAMDWRHALKRQCVQLIVQATAGIILKQRQETENQVKERKKKERG